MFRFILVALFAAAPAAAATAPEALQQSYVLEAVGDAAGALAALEETPAGPQRGYLYAYRRGWLLYSLGKHEDAVAAYNRAAAAAPESLEAPVAMLLPQLAMRRWIDAVDTANRVLKRDPRNNLARRRLGWALFNLGRYPAAETAYAGVLADYPSDVEMQTGVGWSRLKRGDAAGARQAFDAALAMAPRNAAALAGVQALGDDAAVARRR